MATVIGNRILNGSAPVASDVPQNNLTGYQWLDGSSNLYEWNPGTSQWILVGKVTNTAYGLLSKAGGTMTGAIDGAHALAPVTSPNFQTSAKRDNIELATMDDLAALETKINTTIDSKISSSISTVSSGVAFGNNIKIIRGRLNVAPEVETNLTDPIGTWPDGTKIQWTNCVWSVIPIGFGRATSDTSTDTSTLADQKLINYGITRTSENPAKFKVRNRYEQGGVGVVSNAIVEYLVIAIRG